MWQEIITYIIIAIAAGLAVRKAYLKFKKPSGCDSCSSDSCAACGLADLKKEMDEKKGRQQFTTKTYNPQAKSLQ
jgi:positive regulator of sigma E activity